MILCIRDGTRCTMTSCGVGATRSGPKRAAAANMRNPLVAPPAVPHLVAVRVFFPFLLSHGGVSSILCVFLGSAI